MKQLDAAMTTMRRVQTREVEYRSAGQYICDQWSAHLGDRTAQERIEVYSRAAAHQKTSDNLGVIPIPQIGEVINFIDASRPIVNAIGPRNDAVAELVPSDRHPAADGRRAGFRRCGRR
jgi:hypothetical protein